MDELTIAGAIPQPVTITMRDGAAHHFARIGLVSLAKFEQYIASKLDEKIVPLDRVLAYSQTIDGLLWLLREAHVGAITFEELDPLIGLDMTLLSDLVNKLLDLPDAGDADDDASAEGNAPSTS